MSPSTEHVGPLARSAFDAAAALEVVAGRDPADAHSVQAPTRDFSSTIRAGIRGRTIGIPDDFFFDDLAPDVAGAVDDARSVLDGLGARLRGVRLPWAGVGGRSLRPAHPD